MPRARKSDDDKSRLVETHANGNDYLEVANRLSPSSADQLYRSFGDTKIKS